MTKSNRQATLDYIFLDEGGYAERPQEGGGAVNMGITFTVFSAWRKAQGIPAPTFADLKAMGKDEAAAIYDEQYLDRIWFDAMPVGIGYAVLDAAILGGVSGSIKALQRALGFKGPAIDGVFALVTRWAVTHRDPAWLVNTLCDQRLTTYKTFKNWKVPIRDGATRTWGDVWTTRIGRVRKRALAMIAEAPPPPLKVPVITAAATAKAAMVVVPNTPDKWLEPPAGKFNGIVGANYSPAELETYLSTLKFAAWKPTFVTLHNTYQPTLDQWYATPGGTRQRLLNIWVRYKKLGWSGGPHFFVEAADDERPIWIGNPLTVRGTHSPSFNATSWAVEMVGDFSESPFDPAVKANTVAMLAVLHRFLGISPDTLKFHKEDPRTTHDCPGKNVSKPEMIRLVKAAM